MPPGFGRRSVEACHRHGGERRNELTNETLLLDEIYRYLAAVELSGPRAALEWADDLEVR